MELVQLSLHHSSSQETPIHHQRLKVYFDYDANHQNNNKDDKNDETCVCLQMQKITTTTMMIDD